MPDKYIEEVLKDELAILDIDKKMKNRKNSNLGNVSKVEDDDLAVGNTAKSLITSMKGLDEDGMSDSQEEDNVTNSANETFVERHKRSRK